MVVTLHMFLMFIGVGLGTGLLAGFVGVGGGVIMVPVLLETFRSGGLPTHSVVHAAMGTSLSVAVFSVSSSILRHNRQKRIRWKLVRWLAPGCLVGGWTGAHLATHLDGIWLLLVLAMLLVFAAFRMLLSKDVSVENEKTAARPKVAATGLGVGLISGLSGLAGGVVLVPSLSVILGLPGSWLAGTSSGTIVFSSLAAAAGYLTARPPEFLGTDFFGYICLPLTLALALGAIPGAQVGAWVNRLVKGYLLRKMFGVLLLLVAFRLVFFH